MFSVRVAGNVIGDNLLGSLEYAAVVSGVKLLMVMGHKHCGAVNSSLKLLSQGADVAVATGCPHLPVIVDQIKSNVSDAECQHFLALNAEGKDSFANQVAKRNVCAWSIRSRKEASQFATPSGKESCLSLEPSTMLTTEASSSFSCKCYEVGAVLALAHHSAFRRSDVTPRTTRLSRL